jgi:hypothetical protein
MVGKTKQVMRKHNTALTKSPTRLFRPRLLRPLRLHHPLRLLLPRLLRLLRLRHPLRPFHRSVRPDRVSQCITE